MSDSEDLTTPEQDIEAIVSELPAIGNDGQLASILNLLSDQLYANAGRFLFEILQNVDDASYPAGKDPPTLRLTHDGNLRLDYNELGFRKIDVQAICRIGGSTKTNSASTTGEKGIGFKSIFRVADAVWIASHRTEPRPRTYTFKFEKSGSLGQIRPIWVSGAMSGDMRPPQDGGTSMYLEVPEAKRDKVRSALDGFDPTTLLFLRKLTRIEIQRGERPLRMLHRTMEEAPDGCRHDVVFEAIAGVSTPVRCYKTLRFDVDGLPRRLKQGDRTRSEMLLSFPVTPNFDSATSSESQCHKVYTYLPVKDYGFKFTLQADFILSTSREDILEDEEWNKKLLNSLPDAVLEAIYVFNKSGLRYSWPVFLPTKLNYFFHGLDIPGEIQYKPILETENGGDQLVSPRLTHPALVRVPGKFRIEGEPAIPGKDQKSRYLSSKYHEACNEPLRMLGVEEMSYGRFQEDFREFVSQSHDEFMGMNPEWHEAVAQIIVENDPRLISSSYAFANLDIVPLKGKNKWTTGGRNSTTLFFASELDSINAFPRGIGLRQIEETAQKTEHRRRLFELLGARDPTKHVPEIKYQIDRQHTSLDTSWLMLLTMEDLVSHVLFLFVNQTKWSGNIDLWIMTRSGKRCRASGTYLEPLSFGSRQLNVPILHEAYLQAVGPDERRSLLIFLENGLGIASFPRLVSSVGDTLRLTREMKTIVNWAKDDTIGFLELLEQHWDHYRRWLYRDGGEKGQSEFRRQIIEAKVLCTDGILHPLNRTVLPSPSLLDVGHELPLPLLPTARADFPRWKFLLDLDVLDRVRVDTWIECLRTMASKTSETPTQAQVDAIYQRIESALKVSDRHLADVQTAFRDHNIIQIPLPKTVDGKQAQGVWVPTERCTWERTKHAELRYHFCLEPYYPNRIYLFVNRLRLGRSIRLSHLQREVEGMLSAYYRELPTTLEPSRILYINSLLREMGHQIARLPEPWPSSDRQDIEALKEYSMMPISFQDSTVKQPLVILSSAKSRNEWFIADRIHLQRSFSGRVALLAMDVLDVESPDCKKLFDALDCNGRRLSRVAVPRIQGKHREDRGLSARMKAIARYMDSLSEAGRDKVGGMRYLEDIRVFTSSKVEVIWSVGKRASALDSRRSVVTIDKNTRTLMIYVRRADQKSWQPPVELTEEICVLFNIPSERRHHVQFILGYSSDDMQDLEDTLIKAGFHILPDLGEEDKKVGNGIPATRKPTDGSEINAQKLPATTKQEKPRENKDPRPGTGNPTVLVTQPNNNASPSRNSSHAARPTKKHSNSTTEVQVGNTENGEDVTLGNLAGSTSPALKSSQVQPGPRHDENKDASRFLLPGRRARSLTRSMSSFLNVPSPATRSRSLSVTRQPAHTTLSLEEGLHMAEMIAMQQSGLEQLVPASSIPDEDGYEGGLPDGGFRDSSDESSSTQESPVEESNDAGTPSDESDKDSQFLGVVNDEDFVKLLPKIEAAMGSKQSSRGSGMTPGERVLRYQASEFLVQLPQYYKAQGKDGGAPILEKTRKEQRSRKATNSPSTVAQTSLMNPNGTDADPHNQLEAMERLISATGRDRRVTTADRKQVVAMQFARLVEGSQLFRLTAPANIVYVSKEEDLQTVDREEKSTDTLAVLQSRMQVFKDPERERIVYSLIPAIATDDDKEAEFLGQAWVSQLLSDILGHAYRPLGHWRRSLRTKLDYPPLNGQANEDIPFSFRDRTGSFAAFLAENGYVPAKMWLQHGENIEYYIDVHATTHDRKSPIQMESSRYHKARELRIRSEDQVPAQVFIFVRIYNLNGMQDCPPCAAVYVNPWALYTCGQVEVEALKHTFSVSFTGMPDVELSSPERWMAIERRRSASKPQPRHCFDRVLTSIQSVLQFVFGETAQEFGEESSQDEENDHSPDLGPKLVREYAWKKLKGGGSKSIRLLKLLDGDAVGEIRGELEEYRLSDPRRPRYYCISYAWGSALKLFPLRMADNSRMLLTASLYLGLRKLWATRKRHDSAEMVYVWADAICIDQIATDEKPKQILLLADIFRSAETVYAWLGDEEDESKSAIKKLEELASVVQAYSGLIKKNIDEFSVLAEEENLLPPKEDKIWGAVSKLLNRRWFSRIWIVQEVVLASKLVVICGDEEIAWETVHAGVLLCFWPELWGHAFSIADERTQKNVRELGNIRAWSRETGSFQKSDDLFTLICAFHQKDATQARDRLFALLSMATETPRSQLELGPADQELESRLSPDYVSSQHDVVKQYAQVFVEKGRALDMLCLARLAWDRDGLPSWVPDLTSQAFPKTISTWSRKFNASGAEISKPVKNSKVGNGVASCDGDALLIQGYKMDRIVKKANISSASNDLVAYIQDIFKFIDDTYGEKLKDSAPQLRMHRIESAKCKVPIGGAKVATTGSWGFDEQQGEVTRLDAYHALVVYLYDEHKGTWEAEARQIRAAAKGDSVLNEKARLWKRVWPYIETVKEFAEMFLPARAIACQTEGKRVGIVPDTAQEGDVVVVFRGAKVPVLLRETEDGSGHVVVGECYVHELMDGGAVSGAIEDGQSPQEFRLL